MKKEASQECKESSVMVAAGEQGCISAGLDVRLLHRIRRYHLAVNGLHLGCVEAEAIIDAFQQ